MRTKLPPEYCCRSSKNFGVKVADFTGGSLRNAIPFEAVVSLLVPSANVAEVNAKVEELFGIIKSEYADTDPETVCFFEKQNEPFTSYIEDDVMLRAVKASNGNALTEWKAMSPTMPGLVETSVNMAVVRTTDGDLTELHSLIRSSVDTAREDVAEKMRCVFELAGAGFTTFGAYSGWTPIPSAPIIGVMKDVYKNLFGVEMKVTAIHAGLGVCCSRSQIS